MDSNEEREYMQGILNRLDVIIELISEEIEEDEKGGNISVPKD